MQLSRNFSRLPVAVYHGGFWLLYLLYIFFLNWLTNKDIQFSEIFVIYVVLIIFFYLCLFGFETAKKKLYVGISYFAILFTVLFFGGYFFLTKILPSVGFHIITKDFSLEGYIQAVLAESVKMFSLSLLYFIAREFFRQHRENHKISEERNQQKLENSEITKKQLEYKYAFLRAQINPHFLFNTLNFLYAQALPKAPDVAENILKLSEMMRYSLDDGGASEEKIALSEEVNYLKKLIEFQKLRFGEKSNIEYLQEGFAGNQQILKMSLVSIIENSLKYTDMSSSEFPLKISVIADEQTVFFNCENKKKSKTSGFSSHKIGMKNLKERLDFYFKDKYDLKIAESDEFYKITLNFFRLK